MRLLEKHTTDRGGLIGVLCDAWQDYLLGRLLRLHQISVMRIESDIVDGNEWSSCDQRMSEDYGHGGKWGGGKTPLEAVKSILPNYPKT
jgi:hypothetical protein